MITLGPITFKRVVPSEPLFATSGAASALNVNAVGVLDVNFNERWLVIHQLLASFTPGAGQNVSERGLAVLTPAADASETYTWLDYNFTALGAGVKGTIVWNGALLVPARRRLAAYGIFNSGVNANASQLWVSGTLIPPLDR